MKTYRIRANRQSSRTTLSPQARAFADACHENALDELTAALQERRADRADCAAWDLTPTEWRAAIATALSERAAENAAAGTPPAMEEGR